MNKQPFYHSASILFTATKSISMTELENIIFPALKKHGLFNIEVEYVEDEAGDPADLVG